MSGEEFREVLQRASHPDDALERLRVVTEAIDSRQQRYRTELRLQIGDETRHVVHRGEISFDDDGVPVSVRGTAQDVTEQRRAEAELLEATERLARQRRAVHVLHDTITRPEFPLVDGYEFAARYLAAEDDIDVGGDWYDVFAQPDGQIMLGVGDGSGHGISAARLMAKLRHATRAYACIESDLAVILATLDAFITQFRDESQIATLNLARLDPATGALEIASAGHLPAVLLHHGDAGLTEVPPGPPLGAGAAPDRFCVVEQRLEPENTLLLYTDGLVERRGGASRMVSTISSMPCGAPLGRERRISASSCSTRTWPM